MTFNLTSRALRRSIAMAGVASIAILAAGPAAIASTTAATHLDTYSDWDGTSYIQPWGHPDTSTYGQTITVDAGDKKLKKFSFYMTALGTSGTITFNGEVYGWDGTKATTEVYESKIKTIDLTAGDPTVKKVTIRTKGAKVQAGKQYVIFLSISKTYEQTDPNVTSQWAFRITDALPGGDAVFMNDTGDESQWTTVPWAKIIGNDMAFKATLR